MKDFEPKTIIITNLGGPLTRRDEGKLDSGLTKFDTSWGYDPYSSPGNLTWFEKPTSILTLSGVVGPITTMKQRTEGSNNYVYGFAKSGDLYKVQVNDPNTNVADFDQPSVVGALVNTTNVLRGAGMVFYGSTEKIFYGDDSNMMKISFDGSASASVIGSSSVITAVPRPITTFLGKIYFGNGNNIGEIDSTETITTGSRLSPALPAGTVVRDLDVTPDGNYLQILATRNNPNGGFTLLAETPSAATDSFKFLWNGVDSGITASENYSGLTLTSNTIFGDKNYVLGYDPQGTALLSGSQKIVSLSKTISPQPTATFTLGNLLAFVTPESENGVYKASFYNFGQYDNEVPGGLYRIFRQTAANKTDVEFVTSAVDVSNLLYFPSFKNYADKIASTGKIYFSTIESSGSPASDSEILWKFNTAPVGSGSVLAGVYETQNEQFSKKIGVKEVRLYTNPLVTGNSFSIDLIGAGGSILAGTSQNFTVGTNVTAGETMVKYNPASAPTYTLGARITNSSVTGTKNWRGNKLEIDVIPAGK